LRYLRWFHKVIAAANDLRVPAASVLFVDYDRERNEMLIEYLSTEAFSVAPARDSDSGGVGLGLAIAALIMALHGGGTKARNAIGGELIVELRFPCANASADDHII
jgi:signal transduction histidine kinase